MEQFPTAGYFKVVLKWCIKNGFTSSTLKSEIICKQSCKTSQRWGSVGPDPRSWPQLWTQIITLGSTGAGDN